MIDNGLNFFSLSDVTLADFAASVKDPLLAGAVPLILRAPTEVTVSLIRMLLESGAMDMLAPEGGKLSSLLRFLLTPFGGVCLTIVRTCVVAPLPVFAVFVLLIAAVVFGVKKGRAQKRAAKAPKKGETE